MVKSYHHKKDRSPSPINQWPIWNAKTQRSLRTSVAFLKSEIGGYCVLRISLSFKDWRFSWLWPYFDFFKTPPWNDQVKSASTSHSILGFIQIRGLQGVSMDSGPIPQGDRASGILSGFMFSGGNWSVSASFLKGLAGPQSPSGNLAPMGAGKASHDLEKMQPVKWHSSPSGLSSIGHRSLFYMKMFSSDLTRHAGKSSPEGSCILACEMRPSIADRNSLTMWTSQLLEIPEILSASVRQALSVFTFLPVQWKTHTFAKEEMKGGEFVLWAESGWALPNLRI